MVTKKPKEKPRRLKVHEPLYDLDGKVIVKAGKEIDEDELSASTVKWLLKDGKAEAVEGN